MLFWLAFITLTIYIIVAIEVSTGSRRIKHLRDQDTTLPPVAPVVSIVVAARNESKNIREAMNSLLHMDYPTLEIIVVNDRSEDLTGKILDEMARGDSRLKVIHISELPPGWLGKNHALWLGGKHASGELLLFTDADIVMAPGTLAKAVSYMEQHHVDHLAVSPEVKMPSEFLNMFGATFGLVFAIFTRPWRAPDPHSGCHIGIGAFNLVRAIAYHQTGGHKTIALRPDDDLKLGKIIKKAGFRQEMVYGNDLISVEWYSSIREVVLGLEKNVFAGTDYRIWLAAAGVIFHLLASLWPYLAIFTTSGATRLIYTATVAVITLLAADSARFHGLKRWYALGFPLTIGLFVFIIIRTVSCNLVKGGINWRGTFYSLRELKANKI